MYYVKEDYYVYRFTQFADVENFTGKDRALHPRELGAAVRRLFPKAELAGHQGARLKGWITSDGELRGGYLYGNKWSSMRRVRYKKLGET